VGLYSYIGVEILIWMLFAMAYNLALGFTGLPSFCHGTFFGVGGYAMAIYQLEFNGNNLWMGFIVSILAAMIAATIVGLFVSHRRGVYYALLTIGFGQVFWFATVRSYSLTGGDDGLLNLVRLDANFGFISFSIKGNNEYYFLVLGVLAISILFLWALIHSPFGRVIQAIKQNHNRATSIGYNVRVYHLVSLMVSGSISGLAGGLFAMAQQSVFPEVMSLNQAAMILIVTVLGGGLISFWGPIVGTIVYILSRDVLGSLTEAWLIYFSTLFVAIVIFKPEGVVGIWRDLIPKTGVLIQKIPFKK
jgi:branched-chain amino acid transport system permease protein